MLQFEKLKFSCWSQTGLCHPHLRITMFSAIFLKPMMPHLKLANSLHVLPFCWDLESKRVLPIYSGFTLNKIRIHLGAIFVYTVLQFIMQTTSPYPLTRKMVGIAFSLIYVTSFGFQWNRSFDTSPISMLNAFMDFERQFVKGQLKVVLLLRAFIIWSFYMQGPTKGHLRTKPFP